MTLSNHEPYSTTLTFDWYCDEDSHLDCALPKKKRPQALPKEVFANLQGGHYMALMGIRQYGSKQEAMNALKEAYNKSRK